MHVHMQVRLFWIINETTGRSKDNGNSFNFGLYFMSDQGEQREAPEDSGRSNNSDRRSRHTTKTENAN